MAPIISSGLALQLCITIKVYVYIFFRNRMKRVQLLLALDTITILLLIVVALLHERLKPASESTRRGIGIVSIVLYAMYVWVSPFLRFYYRHGIDFYDCAFAWSYGMNLCGSVAWLLAQLHESKRSQAHWRIIITATRAILHDREQEEREMLSGLDQHRGSGGPSAVPPLIHLNDRTVYCPAFGDPG